MGIAIAALGDRVTRALQAGGIFERADADAVQSAAFDDIGIEALRQRRRPVLVREGRDLQHVPASRDQRGKRLADGQGATAYLLTSNYRVILDYNCSNFYALSVGLLADAVER